MGPVELHLITKSPLNFCYLLLGRISQPLLNEYSWMQISRSPVRPASHQLFLNTAALLGVNSWDCARQPRGLEQTRQFAWEDLTVRNEFLLSATLPLVFPCGENTEVELLRCRLEGCIKPVRSSGSRFHQIHGAVT